jgi:hypothetical protein
MFVKKKEMKMRASLYLLYIHVHFYVLTMLCKQFMNIKKKHIFEGLVLCVYKEININYSLELHKN